MSVLRNPLERLALKQGRQVTRLVLYSIAVGIAAGIGALVFSWSLEIGSELVINKLCGVELPREGKHVLPQLSAAAVPHTTQALEAGETTAPYHFEPPPWRQRLWILFVPALGGLACGLLVCFLAPEAVGHGTDSVIDAFHNKRGVIRKRIPAVKIIASALTISTGGVAGREGPIAQVAAGCGSFLADILRLTARQRRILIIAGVGAGVGSMFRAPLGGALFAVDVLYRDTEFEYEALIPAFIASIVGYTTYGAFTPAGLGHIFDIPTDLVFPSAHLPLAILLSVVLALAGWAYIRSFYGITALFRHRLALPAWLKPALGGLVIGAIGLADPRLLTTGYGWVQQAIDGHLGLSFMLVLIVAKILMTSVTIGSGGSGGVFGPSVVIGGLIGGAFGLLCQRWFPSVQPAAFVCLGMAGFFAGAAKVPISTIIMVSEMTVGYALLLPLMLVSSLTYLLAPQRVTLYIKQVGHRVDSPAHLGDFVVDILERIRVREVLRRGKADCLCVDYKMPLLPLLEQVTESDQSVFPLLDKDQRLTGLIRLDDLRGAFMQPELQSLIIAEDIAFHRFESLQPDDNLNQALRKLRFANCAELPVTSPEHPEHVLGMISRHEILQAYSTRMEELFREDPSYRPETEITASE